MTVTQDPSARGSVHGLGSAAAAWAGRLDARLPAVLVFARSAVRKSIIVVVVAFVVAAMLTAVHTESFAANLVYSACVSGSIWFFAEIGVWAIRRWRRRGAPTDGTAASRRAMLAWVAPWIVVATGLGYETGIAFGNALLGKHAPGLGLFATNPRAPAISLMLSLVASVVITFWLFARARLAEVNAQAESAQRIAIETRLKLLEAQLEPHMLFNTLANLRVLIGVDPARAQAMLDRLIAFLRATLSASRAGMQPLASEFARVEDYLALMAVRMGPRLFVRLDLPSHLRDVPVPPLVLQPLVENAIQHGLEPKVEGGRLEVAAHDDGAVLVLTVRDTGVGLSESAVTAGTHFGLAQVRERLTGLYGARAEVALLPAGDAEGGTVARLMVPLAGAPAAA
jgi:signal transduction histidine kinase